MQTIIGRNKFSRKFSISKHEDTKTRSLLQPKTIIKTKISKNLPLKTTNLTNNTNPLKLSTPLPMQGEQGWVSRYTLMTPLTPFSGGCKPSVYRCFDTLAPLNQNFPMQKAFPLILVTRQIFFIKMSQRTVPVIPLSP